MLDDFGVPKPSYKPLKRRAPAGINHLARELGQALYRELKLHHQKCYQIARRLVAQGWTK